MSSAQGRVGSRDQVYLETILEMASDAIVIVDDNGSIVRVNPATERMFRYPAGELVGRSVRLLIPSRGRDRWRDSGTPGRRRDEWVTIGAWQETEAFRRDGRAFPLELAVSTVEVDGGFRFIAMMRDIAERRESRARLEEALALVAENAQKLRALLDLIRIGALLVDSQGCVEFANDLALNLLGLDPAVVVGQPFSLALDGMEAYAVRVTQAMAVPAAERVRVPVIVERPGGRNRQLEIEVRDDPRERGRRILFVHDLTELHDLRTTAKWLSIGRLVGSGPAMAEVFRAIRNLAPGDWTTLIEGETGTGKEMVARAIHAASPRHAGRFVVVNCGGLTESLLSSQLFGHRRGSFTGAVADQEGLFEAADGGTLLLDEVGELPLTIQSHLLRVLQEKEIVRVGDTKPKKVDVRILAATNRNLEEEVAAGTFRRDLLYRIRVGRIHLPRLRDRSEDIPALVELFMSQAREQGRRTVRGVSSDALAVLVAYTWPGNVRELKSAIDHAVIHCRSEEIGISDLPPEVFSGRSLQRGQRAAAPAQERVGLPNLAEILEDDERARIIEAIRITKGNRTAAARYLGVSRATLYRRLDVLRIAGRGRPRDRR